MEWSHPSISVCAGDLHQFLGQSGVFFDNWHFRMVLRFSYVKSILEWSFMECIGSDHRGMHYNSLIYLSLFVQVICFCSLDSLEIYCYNWHFGMVLIFVCKESFLNTLKQSFMECTGTVSSIYLCLCRRSASVSWTGSRYFFTYDILEWSLVFTWCSTF